VIGYQVSWMLMFADYSRYTASARKATAAVFLGLLVTSVWMMPLGFVAARAAASADPGAMMQAVGLGAWGALLMTAAALTTNFVNIYMSALALRSLLPNVGPQASIWSTGLVGAALSLFSGSWLDQYANLMLVLGGILVPVGGVLLARFFLLERPGKPQQPVAALYDREGSYARSAGFDVAGLAAWLGGGVTFYFAAGIGATLPSLLVSVGIYWGLAGRGRT
jgi:purine-cytosine permease-like protein